MEILEINSSHSLTMSMTDKRPAGAHSYRVNCRQFISTYEKWLKQNAARENTFGVMTLGFDRLWITKPECAEIARAIQMSHSPLTLD